MLPAHAGRSARRCTILLALCSAGLLILAACESDSEKTADPDPTTRALSDPMHFSPDFDNDTVTGGGPTQFDPKAFKKDVNDVVNPPPP
jgi:hypothetical protein